MKGYFDSVTIKDLCEMAQEMGLKKELIEDSCIIFKIQDIIGSERSIPILAKNYRERKGK